MGYVLERFSGRGPRPGCPALQRTRREAMNVNETSGHPPADFREHARTYRGFVRATQISVAAIMLTLILMAIFLL